MEAMRYGRIDELRGAVVDFSPADAVFLIVAWILIEVCGRARSDADTSVLVLCRIEQPSLGRCDPSATRRLIGDAVPSPVPPNLVAKASSIHLKPPPVPECG